MPVPDRADSSESPDRRPPRSRSRPHVRHNEYDLCINVRYRGTDNADLVLRHDVPVRVSGYAHPDDVWRKARRQSSRLQKLHSSRKVLATDATLKGFQEVVHKARVKDVLRERRDRWIFVVERSSKDCSACDRNEKRGR